MPVTFDNFGTSFSSGVDCNVNFLFTAAADTVLLVYTVGDGTRSVSAIAYNGVALTQLFQDASHQLWALTAPTAGINTLSVDWVTTGGALQFRAVAVTYLNVKAVGGFGTLQGTKTAAAVVGNLSLSSSTTDIVAYFVRASAGGNLDALPGTTRLSGSASANARFVFADVAGAATISLSASAAAATTIRIIGQPLIFSVAAAGATRLNLRALLGVGY